MSLCILLASGCFYSFLPFVYFVEHRFFDLFALADAIKLRSQPEVCLGGQIFLYKASNSISFGILPLYAQND